MLAGIVGIGLAGSGYCMPFMMARTSGMSVNGVALNVPCRMASLCSLSSKGPSLVARGPVTKGVSAAWQKCCCPSVVRTSKSCDASIIVFHVAIVSWGSLGTNSRSSFIYSSSLSHSPRCQKIAACFSACKSCRRAATFVVFCVSTKCSARSSRKVSLIFLAPF
jgi:hypothetical protein